MGSGHDLFSQGYLLLGSQRSSDARCSICHQGLPPDRPRIWDNVPQSLENFGSSGIICASCHDGVSIVDKNVDAGITVFNPDSHKFGAALGSQTYQLKSAGFLLSDSMEFNCLSCHDVHSQARRPFLRVEKVQMCQPCHEGLNHSGYGKNNSNGNHPVAIEPFDNTGGASPITITDPFAVPFPGNYPLTDGMYDSKNHWIAGGHLTFGSYGRIECFTCHALHGLENTGPVENLLAADPVKRNSDEFCEGCHRGQRGDGELQPPYPNPGGTIVARTYHPADNDSGNDIGWNAAIADTTDLANYQWGETDPDTDLPVILCTTCHRAHNGMPDSPCLVHVSPDIEDQGVSTFCEICHFEPPVGHHGYEDGGLLNPETEGQITLNSEDMGHTYGSPEDNRVYCSLCHRAHNAGYGLVEENYIPILVNKGTALCKSCHQLRVSHFMGDATLPSTYAKPFPSLYRDPWPVNGYLSYYGGEGENPTTITCLSCHTLRAFPEDVEPNEHRLLAPANPDSEWTDDTPNEYLCTGCHGSNPVTEGEGHSHPYMEARTWKFPEIFTNHLLPDELPVTYTDSGKINCHSCHSTHNAVDRGGVYILKVVRGENVDPKAIRPAVDYTTLCHSCHSSQEY